ncbi:MAG: hypothetical protein H6693_10475 [Candidatus Latescibacteria bacterium]|nr:hypothetical protein [Candidatus Latescibacterota bacterium]
MFQPVTFVILIAHIAIIILTYNMAKRKNRNLGGWTALSVAIGIVALVILVFLPTSAVDPDEIDWRKQWQ